MALISGLDAPSGRSAVKHLGAVYALSRDEAVVRVSDVGDPTKWTPPESGADASTAAIINVGQHAGGEIPNGMAVYKGRLLVFFESSIQAWDISTGDTRQATLTETINIGTLQPRSIANTPDSVLFLSQEGFRSVELLRDTPNLQELDIGAPIAEFTRKLVKDVDFSFYSTRYGQYWCGAGGEIFVLSISHLARVAAWSIFRFEGVNVLDGVEAGGEVYLYARKKKGGDRVILKYGGEAAADKLDGESGESRPIGATAEFVGADGGSPLVRKTIDRVSLVHSGGSQVSMALSDAKRNDTPFSVITYEGADGDLTRIPSDGGDGAIIKIGLTAKTYSGRPIEIQRITLRTTDTGDED